MTKEKVIARIVKHGNNEKNAKRIVDEYFELAIRYGCKTVKEFADAVTGFAAC